MNNLPFDFTVDKAANAINIIKAFDAELSLVWRAFTKQEILDQWWAPKPLASKTKVMNFKVGGRRFYAMVWPDGREYWGVEKYILINPKTKIKWVASFTDKDENINAELPTSEWELNFSEQNGVTTVRISIYFGSFGELEKTIEMGTKEGLTMTLNELASVLKTLKK